MRRLLVATVLLGALGLIAAPARAGVPAAWQAKALATAQRVWHPACGQLSIAMSDPDATGVVVVNDAPGHEGDVVQGAAGFTVPGSCSLGVNSSVDWRELGYPVFCHVVLHEGGRAAGAAGKNGVTGIMSVNLAPTRGEGRIDGKHRTYWYGVDRRCIRPIDRR